VTVNERPVLLTAGRLRAVLAVLALSAGRGSVQTYMARLRSALGAEAIGSTPAGYVLRTDPDRVDALQRPCEHGSPLSSAWIPIRPCSGSTPTCWHEGHRRRDAARPARARRTERRRLPPADRRTNSCRRL
jgi:hypothetical protein